MHAGLGSKTVRQMSFLSHYKFKQRLIAKAAVRGVKVLVVSEHYTSKTCGSCGRLKEDLGSAKTFRCDHCAAVLDRDCNGARNILLRAIRRREFAFWATARWSHGRYAMLSLNRPTDDGIDVTVCPVIDPSVRIVLPKPRSKLHAFCSLQ
jgi:hypothetical protein